MKMSEEEAENLIGLINDLQTGAFKKMFEKIKAGTVEEFIEDMRQFEKTVEYHTTIQVISELRRKPKLIEIEKAKKVKKNA